MIGKKSFTIHKKMPFFKSVEQKEMNQIKKH